MNDKLFDKTWNINTDASLLSTDWKPNNEIRNYERIGDGYKVTVQGSSAGTEYEWTYTAEKDGVPVKVIGREDVDSIVAYKVTDEITIGDFYKAGRIVAGYQRKLSADGNKLTVITSGISSKGSPYFDVLEYTSNQ